VSYDLGPTVIEKIIAGDFTESVYDLTTGVQTGTKVKGTDVLGGDSMGMATAIGISAGVSALSNIYGAKKAASVQEKALNQAQANLEKDAQQAEAAWGAWYKRQAPVMQTRNDALMAMRGQYKKRPEGTPDLFTNEFRGWPSAPSQAPQVAQPQATMASVSPGMRTGMGEGGLVPVPMKDGGVVTEPTVALIGEAGPEAVVPLSGAGRTDTGPFAWGQGSSGGRMGDIGGGVMPLPPGPWGGGGGGQMPPPIETSPDWPPFPRPTPGPPREGPLPDRRIPTPEDRRRQADRLERDRALYLQNQEQENAERQRRGRDRYAEETAGEMASGSSPVGGGYDDVYAQRREAMRRRRPTPRGKTGPSSRSGSIGRQFSGRS
jgi:hypothetical protein